MEPLLRLTDVLVTAVRRTSRAMAWVAGGLLLVAVALVVAEIVLRLMGSGLASAHELSGYILAVVSAWGFAYALVERVHVRIDVVYLNCGTPLRAAMDALALVTVAAVAAVIVWQAIGVVDTSIARGSRANTPLQTPLWIPQAIWFAGLVWFLITALVLTLRVAVALVARRPDLVVALSQGTASPADPEVEHRP